MKQGHDERIESIINSSKCERVHEHMKFRDEKNDIVSDNAKEASKDFLNNLIDAVLGDSIAAGRVMVAIAKSPFFIREQIFWRKFFSFLEGVYLSEKDRRDLRVKITENGTKGENPFRLIEYIDRAETQKKMQYLVNATRCLLADFIDIATYFRICHDVTYTLDEDLHFLKTHIEKSNLSYDAYVQGLLTAGLMYQSVIDGNGDQKYSFTPMAEDVDKFAVSYDNLERYPNPQSSVQKSNLQTRIPSSEWKYF